MAAQHFRSQLNPADNAVAIASQSDPVIRTLHQHSALCATASLMDRKKILNGSTDQQRCTKVSQHVARRKGKWGGGGGGGGP